MQAREETLSLWERLKSQSYKLMVETAWVRRRSTWRKWPNSSNRKLLCCAKRCCKYFKNKQTNKQLPMTSQQSIISRIYIRIYYHYECMIVLRQGFRDKYSFDLWVRVPRPCVVHTIRCFSTEELPNRRQFVPPTSQKRTHKDTSLSFLVAFVFRLRLSRLLAALAVLVVSVVFFYHDTQF